MPRPAGWSAEDEATRDSCVTSLMREGVPPPKTAEQAGKSPRSRAYAICTAMVEKHRRGGNPVNAAQLIAQAKAIFKMLPKPKV